VESADETSRLHSMSRDRPVAFVMVGTTKSTFTFNWIWNNKWVRTY